MLDVDIKKKEPISKQEYVNLKDILTTFTDTGPLDKNDMNKIFQALSNYFFVDDERSLMVKETWGNQKMVKYKENSEILSSKKTGEKNRIPANSLLFINPECNPLLDENGKYTLKYNNKCKCDAGLTGSMRQEKDNLASASQGYTHIQNLIDIGEGWKSKIKNRFPLYLDYNASDSFIKTLNLPLFENLEFSGRGRWDENVGIKFECSGESSGYNKKAISSVLQLSPFLAWLEEKLFTLNLDIYKYGETEGDPYTIERLLEEDYGKGVKSYEVKTGSNFYNLLKNFWTNNHLIFADKTYEEMEAIHQKTIGMFNAAAGVAGLTLGILGLPFISMPLLATAGGKIVTSVAGIILGLPGPLTDFTNMSDGETWVQKTAKIFKIRIETLKNLPIETKGGPIDMYELLRLTYYSVNKKTFRSLMKCADTNTVQAQRVNSPIKAQLVNTPSQFISNLPEKTVIKTTPVIGSNSSAFAEIKRDHPISTSITETPVEGRIELGDSDSSENPDGQTVPEKSEISGGGKSIYSFKRRKQKKKKTKMKRKKNKSKTKRRKRSKH